MIVVPRTDTSLLGRWWWTVDRWSFGALLLLAGLGAVMVMAASPAVAERIGLDSFFLAKRHLMMLVPATFLMMATSLLAPKGVRRLAVVVFVLATIGMVTTLFVGDEIKGARRWVGIAGFSLQPSEFIRPAFAVVTAWLLALQRVNGVRWGDPAAIGLYALVIGLLILQPDFGMSVAVTGVWVAQYFVAGLPMILVVGFAVAGVAGLGLGYTFLPHVQSRIDRFLDPASGDSYQIDTALSAFRHGGLWGTGPGEGVVKALLPDAHADFIFAVIGEEFGLVVCLLIVGLFAFVVLRGLARLTEENSLFVMLAAAGLLAQFGLQALINIGVALHLLPTKGSTLPFISYGGSSVLALALGMGMLLALSRRQPGGKEVL
ncbi:MAG: cell division protein FtsW [Rhodospirillaceae bacterium]|nr:cell division protein FtsW [Rhodospirillaceae bacterium]